jgi:ferric-dicitrate binding protein FerR (iron transport regulator)
MSTIGAQDRMREAARWFAVRRRGVMTVDERALYELWVSDANNVSAMARLEQTWATMGAAEQRMRTTRQAASSLPRRSRLARPALLAAMCAVSLGIGVLSYADDSGFWTTLNWTDR